MLEFCYGWWAADYNDPCNFINSLFVNETGAANFGQINDPQTQIWMTEALGVTDLKARKRLYYDIQKHLIEEVFPIAFSYSTLQCTIYVSNLKGWNTSAWYWPLKNVHFD